MRVILYMATTINGFIAKENDSTNFVSEIEWKSFHNMVKQVGNMIIGRRTYEIMQKSNEFSGLDKIKVVVMTYNTFLRSSNPNIIFTAKTPKEVIELLQQQGFNEILVAGGGKLNAKFMKEGLIDEIYLDVEPVAFGKGIKLFSEEDFETNLELVGIKKLSQNEVQLHYKVKRSLKK